MRAVQIEESFIALKAVRGAMSAPVAPRFSYRTMMDHEWHKDPKFKRMKQEEVMLCRRGFHAFPPCRLDDWWDDIPPGSRNDGYQIWIVEVSGWAVYDRRKMAATYLRFMSRLTKAELRDIEGAELATAGWDPQIESEYRSLFGRLRLDGLVWCNVVAGIGINYNSNYRPKLIRVSDETR